MCNCNNQQSTISMRLNSIHRLHPLPAFLGQTRCYFDKSAARKEQMLQELRTISATDRTVWGFSMLNSPQYNKGTREAFLVIEKKKHFISRLLLDIISCFKLTGSKIFVQSILFTAVVGRGGCLR